MRKKSKNGLVFVHSVARSVCLTLEVDFTVAVRVENVDHSLNQWILLQFGKRHELVNAQRARIVKVQLAKTFAQPFDFIRVDCFRD